MKKFWLIDYKYIDSIKENTGYLITPDVIDSLKWKYKGEKYIYISYDDSSLLSWKSLCSHPGNNPHINEQVKEYLEKLDYVYSGEITRKSKLEKINFI